MTVPNPVPVAKLAAGGIVEFTGKQFPLAENDKPEWVIPLKPALHDEITQKFRIALKQAQEKRQEP